MTGSPDLLRGDPPVHHLVIPPVLGVDLDRVRSEVGHLVVSGLALFAIHRNANVPFRFRERLAQRTPDFQTEKGYAVSKPGTANLSMSTNQLAERFGATSMTLEMPFKDNDDLPDPEHAWSPARSKQMARDCLATLAELIDSV